MLGTTEWEESLLNKNEMFAQEMLNVKRLAIEQQNKCKN